jgi:Arc/MetJ-type ribon-helix-helix transcriptional regulator
MAKDTIQIRIDEDTKKFIETLVKSNLFKTRSDAIRYLLSMGMSNAGDIDDILKKVDRLKELERKEKKIPVEIPGTFKNLVRNRDRFD